ncbi:MAG: hypothetical protein AAF551_08160, partial [Bacteroidota bacterium]
MKEKQIPFYVSCDDLRHKLLTSSDRFYFDDKISFIRGGLITALLACSITVLGANLKLVSTLYDSAQLSSYIIRTDSLIESRDFQRARHYLDDSLSVINPDQSSFFYHVTLNLKIKFL